MPQGMPRKQLLEIIFLFLLHVDAVSPDYDSKEENCYQGSIFLYNSTRPTVDRYMKQIDARSTHLPKLDHQDSTLTEDPSSLVKVSFELSHAFEQVGRQRPCLSSKV
jgi:hypothetical protein